MEAQTDDDLLHNAVFIYLLPPGLLWKNWRMDAENLYIIDLFFF